MELLKSGIVKGSEYMRLLRKAQDGGNHTMARLIGKYAADAAAARAENNGFNDDEAKALRMVDYAAKADTGKDRIDAFDDMTALYGRCVKNPYMIDHWERFTAEVVEKF
jgi:hypothetical protein